ncbi:hypothetical protein ACFOU2_10900 [Bacillus songklensis]|uniref:Transcriptional regulator TetR C-terminal Firmicutes type domain-containing protein n=1 Tax=Bacillus songklensis TaxID=1069116 RepID=A0ABV8B133_9BACI
MREELVPDTVADCMIGMFERFTFKWLIPGKKDESILAKEMTEILLYGILAYPKEQE